MHTELWTAHLEVNGGSEHWHACHLESVGHKQHLDAGRWTHRGMLQPDQTAHNRTQCAHGTVAGVKDTPLDTRCSTRSSAGVKHSHLWTHTWCGHGHLGDGNLRTQYLPGATHLGTVAEQHRSAPAGPDALTGCLVATHLFFFWPLTIFCSDTEQDTLVTGDRPYGGASGTDNKRTLLVHTWWPAHGDGGMLRHTLDTAWYGPCLGDHDSPRPVA
jgi:hypothetical protein